MDDNIKNSIENKRLYVYKVYEIIKDFFGEDRVDSSLIENPTEEYLNRMANEESVNENITIHFPKVKVTNEHNKSIDIYDLFVRIWVNKHGAYRNMKMLRTTYTPDQAASRYTHSHLPRSIAEWNNPCLGNGPLVRTTNSLYYEVTRFSEETWQLFCMELNLYVQVESLSGGPYIRLESVGNGSKVEVFNPVYHYPYSALNEHIDSNANCTTSYKDIIKHILINNLVKFNFINGHYNIAMSLEEFAVMVSNAYIRIMRSKGNSNRLNEDPALRQLLYSEGSFYQPNGNYSSILERFRREEDVVSFKGQFVKLKLIGGQDDIESLNYVYLLRSGVLYVVYSFLVDSINYIYGNKTKIKGPVEILRTYNY